MKKLMLAVVSVLALGGTARAGLIEIRGGVGLNAANPDDFENKVKTTSNQDLGSDSFDNYNVDVFINLPALPIGVGLRQEWLNQDQSAGGAEWDLKAQNTSLLVDLRLIDTAFYVGPIVGAGYPSGDLDFKSGTSNISQDIDRDQISYFLGAEAGLKLSNFIVGAEAGYQSLKFEQKGANSLDAKIDLSGFYGKAMVGVTFF